MTPEFAVRAVLSDVDNTLVGNDSQEMPSVRVTTAMQAAGEVVYTGLVSARPPSKVDHLRALGLTGVSSLSNNAQLYDEKRAVMILERMLDKHATLEIAAQLQKEGVRFWIQDDGRDHNFSTNYVPYKPFVIVANRVSEQKAGYIRESVTSRYEDVAVTPGHRHEDGAVDLFIAHPKANKGEAVTDIAQLLDIDPKEVMVVGDGLNDISLMEKAGLAVAVGNAQPEVKAKAHHVVSSWDHDGVAQAVEQFVLFDRTTHLQQQ